MSSGTARARVLLDTHVALWLLIGDRARFSAAAQALLGNETTDLLLSAASVWEIAVKRSLGKLELEDRWLTALHRLDLRHLPITTDHAARVEHLPWHHRDPFDRLLVAQAQAEECAIMAADARLSAYDVPLLSVSM